MTLSNRPIEQVWCGIRSGGENVLIGCIYRPDNSPEYSSRVGTSIIAAKQLVRQGRFNSLIVA